MLFSTINKLSVPSDLFIKSNISGSANAHFISDLCFSIHVTQWRVGGWGGGGGAR